MKKILSLIAGALIGFLPAEFVRARGFDEKEQAQIAKVLPQAKVSLEEALATSTREGEPIAAGFEIDKGKLSLWVFVRKGNRFLKVTLDYDGGEIVDLELTTKKDDLRDAKNQSQAMERARISLREATEKTMWEH